MLDFITYVQNLRPSSRDIYGLKRNLTGLNVYIITTVAIQEEAEATLRTSATN